jgi:hypothetical protein
LTAAVVEIGGGAQFELQPDGGADVVLDGDEPSGTTCVEPTRREPTKVWVADSEDPACRVADPPLGVAPLPVDAAARWAAVAATSRRSAWDALAPCE